MNANALSARDELAGDAFFHDPYPYFQRLRASGRPVWLTHEQQTTSDGILLFTRYAEALALFCAAQGVSKNLRAIRSGGTGPVFDRYLLHRDGAEHIRLRRLINAWFSAQGIERLTPMIAATARELLAPLLQRDEIDLVADFAEPLPLRVIARLIGVPPGDMAQIRAWSLLLADGFDSLLADADIRQRQQQAMEEFEHYITARIAAQRRAKDASTLLGFLVQAEGRELDHEEVTGMTGLLLLAGHETTVNLIGSATWLLLAHDEWKALRADPSLIPGALEEVLRFESPAQRSSFRLTTAPLDINGYRLEPGQQVGVFIGSINRDEDIFANAEVFDIRRRPNRHLAFGAGTHNCLGRSLARTEALIALQTLLASMPAPRLLDAVPQWRRNSFFRGLRSLRIAPGIACANGSSTPQ